MRRGKYSLSSHPEARQRALWLIRDYPNIKEKVAELDGYKGGWSDGGPRGTVPHSSTEDIAIKRAELSRQLDYVDRAIQVVPEEYRIGIWENIQHHKRFPDYAGLKTWKRWKQRFIWYVAYYAGFI